MQPRPSPAAADRPTLAGVLAATLGGAAQAHDTELEPGARGVHNAHMPYVPPRGPKGFPGRSRYTPDLAQAICAALEQGFTLTEICRDPQVGVTPSTVFRWTHVHPQFGAAYRLATAPRQTPGGLHIGKGRWGADSPDVRQAIVDRLVQGRSMQDIARDPDMPGAAVIRKWRRRHMDLHLGVQQARRFSLDLLLDEIIAARDRPEAAPRLRRHIARLTHLGLEPFAANVPPPPTQAEMDAARAPSRKRRPPAAPGLGHNSRRRKRV